MIGPREQDRLLHGEREQVQAVGDVAVAGQALGAGRQPVRRHQDDVGQRERGHELLGGRPQREQEGGERERRGVEAQREPLAVQVQQPGDAEDGEELDGLGAALQHVADHRHAIGLRGRRQDEQGTAGDRPAARGGSGSGCRAGRP